MFLRGFVILFNHLWIPKFSGDKLDVDEKLNLIFFFVQFCS